LVSNHLGLNTNQYGSVFEFRQGADASKKGFSQWSPFGEKTKYFEPSTKEFMINYRVADLKALIPELKTFIFSLFCFYDKLFNKPLSNFRN
jgi:hypothetical protein